MRSVACYKFPKQAKRNDVEVCRKYPKSFLQLYSTVCSHELCGTFTEENIDYNREIFSLEAEKYSIQTPHIHLEHILLDAIAHPAC